MARKVYSDYAFSENARKKSESNYELYKELKEKYKIYRHDLQINLVDGTDCNFSDYDIVIGRKAGYNHALYKVYKNAAGLNNDKLALICDCGNLCFGYCLEGEFIRVFED